ncbi:MAG: SDR family NAD(P)-dependent oxidoreductase [Anaerolineales bacterium]
MNPVALIWGAAGGIGSALVAHLRSLNWDVLAAGRGVDALEELTPYCYDADVASPFAVQAAVTRMSQEADEVSLFVYACGDILSQPVADMPQQIWQQILDANLTGAFLTTQHSLPLLAPQAHLFYLGAVHERLRLPGLSAYAAAKAGLEAFAEVVRKETRRKVSVVRPAAVATRFWEKVPFKLPPHHLQSDDIARRILEAYQEGSQGPLDLS